jgi:hypothetical protein
MKRRRAAADRIARGTAAEVRRRASRTADWIAASPSRRGSVGRLTLVITAVAVGVLVVLHRWPWLMWPLSGWWGVKAWRAGRSDAAEPEAVEEEPEPAPETTEQAARTELYRAILTAIGEDPGGIHLRDLYPALRRQLGLPHLSDPDLRAALTDYGVPIERSMRARGKAGRTGVYRADIEALLNPSPLAESGRGDSAGDAGQSADSPAGEGSERTPTAA